MLCKRIFPEGSTGPCRSRADEQGFTLLEVIAATALMGVALVILLELLGASLVWQGAARSQRQAAQVAELVLGEFCYSKNLRSGNYRGQQGAYSYAVRVTPQYELERKEHQDKIVCFLIKVEVSWRERGVSRSLQLNTMRTVVMERA